MTANEKTLLILVEVLLLVAALSWRMWFIVLGAAVLIAATVWLRPEEGGEEC